MATIYDRDWLKRTIKSYLHDDSVDAELDTWIDLGAKRVSEILRCTEMEDTEIWELLSTTDPGDQDPNITYSTDDFVLHGDLWRTILGWESARASDGEFSAISTSARLEDGAWIGQGEPSVIIVDPGLTGLRNYRPMPQRANMRVRVTVISEVEVPVDPGVVHRAVNAFPMVFLNAALSEAYDWKQNVELQQRYESKWFNEAESIRTRFESNRAGDAPMMRAV